MATIAAIFSSDGHKLPDWLIHSFLLTNNLIRGRERLNDTLDLREESPLARYGGKHIHADTAIVFINEMIGTL